MIQTYDQDGKGGSHLYNNEAKGADGAIADDETGRPIVRYAEKIETIECGGVDECEGSRICLVASIR